MEDKKKTLRQQLKSRTSTHIQQIWGQLQTKLDSHACKGNPFWLDLQKAWENISDEMNRKKNANAANVDLPKIVQSG